MIMAKEDNLIRNSDLTPKERREKAARAGKASAEARRRKKTMREALEMLMFDTELPEALKARMEAEGIKPEDMNHQMAITRSLIAKAEAGDVQAYNAICSMIGEKPVDKLDLGGGVATRLEIIYKGTEADKEFPHSESELDLEKPERPTGE